MSLPQSAKGLTEIANYVGANLALARAIRQNFQDAEAVRGGHQLCYFVDANIVRWYLNPLNDFALVSPLIEPQRLDHANPAGEPVRADGVSGIECATNVISAEYIFSNNLAGSKGFAPFLTPFHADELYESLSAEMGRLHGVDWHVDAQELRGTAASLEKAVKAFKYNNSMDELDRLFEAFSRLLNQAYGKLAFSDPRFRRLFQENRVIRASEFGDFSLDPSYRSGAALEEWKHKLIESGKPQADTRKLERDACSLCLLQHLNREAMADNRPIRFILISIDRDLHEAVDRWRREQGLLDIARFDFARHPRQYIPILNLNAMRLGTEQNIRGFQELMQSVNDITYSVYRDSRVDPVEAIKMSSHSVVRVSKDVRRLVKGERLTALRIDEFTSRWRNALETAVLMNAQMVLGVAQDFVTQSIRPLTEEKVDEALREQIQNSIKNIASGHIEVAAQAQLLAQVRTLRRLVGRSRGAQHPRRHARSPSLARISLPDAISRIFRSLGEKMPDDLASFADELVSAPDSQIIDLFEREIAATKGWAAAKIACVLSFRLGEWERARYFADRVCQMMAPGDAEADEFEYLRLASTRFMGLSISDLQANRRALEAQVGRYGRANDEYGLARSLGEAAAQCLFFAYAQALLFTKDGRAPDFYIWRTVHDAETYLNRAQRVLRNLTGSTASKIAARKIHELQIQILANLLSAYFFGEFQPIPMKEEGVPPRSPPKLEMDELFRLTNSDEVTFRLSEFYALCARKRAGGARWTEKEKMRMRVLLTSFLQERHHEGIDRAEVRWLQEKLAL